MPKKYSFPEMQCSSCPDFQRAGAELWGSRYCNGFPKKRKPKRFKSSDPRSKENQEPPASAGGPVEAAGGDPFGLPGDFSSNFGESSGDGDLPF